MTARWFVLVPFAAAVLACSGGGGGTKPVPRAVVRGTLAQSTAFPVSGQVSVALQWMGAAIPESVVDATSLAPDAPDPEFEVTCVDVVPVTPGGCDGTPTSGHQTCRTTDVLATALMQPVRYAASSFPISFEVPVAGVPPAVAVYDLAKQGGSGVYAMATVLAFVDADGDGALRLGTPGVAGETGLANSAYQDYVPSGGGRRRSYFVTYLDGRIDPGGVHPSYAEVVLSLPQGYALWQKDEVVDAYGRRVSVQRSAQPIDTTPVELVTREGISGSAGWCSTSDTDTTWVDAIPADEVPARCWSGGLAAEWSRTTMVAPCTYQEVRYQASFTCAAAPPPWQSSCP